MLHFCPECRNVDVDKPIVGSKNGYGVAECPDCNETFQFPYLSLYTLEGAPAVGKSTTTGLLEDDIDLSIYEGDLHIDLTNGNLSWGSICDLDFRICMTLHAAGQQALFVGGIHPHELSESPETRYFPRIERCALVCEDADLKERLRNRTEMTSKAVDTFREVNQWYREQASTGDIETFNTSVANPDEVARHVATWIETRVES